MKPNDEGMQRAASENGFRRDYTSMEPFAACSQIKVITLRRRGNNMPLGFSIRGGWEHGTGIFVSEVQPGSIAQRQGLRVGDQIVRINGFSIHRAIHMEVLSLLKTCPGVVLKVRRVGILPVKERRKDPVTWKFVDSASIMSHPANDLQNGRIAEYIPENCIIVKIEFSVPGTTSLGCSIAKGPPEMPGIFMCTVKEGGLAADAGLEVGDQIMDMNGSSFLDVKLAEAVALLKSVKDIKLTVKKAAGVCLFTAQQNSSLSNGHDTAAMGHASRCASSTSPKRRPTPALKEHDFSGSTSSKSEDSSFQSSDSEKDYSISEESGIHIIKPTLQNGFTSHRTNGRQHKKSSSLASTATESGGSSTGSDDASRLDDRWLAEERKKLEEEQKKLQLEKQRLEEEKRRLKKLEKSSSQSSSEESSSFAAPVLLPLGGGSSGGFLQELQKAAAKMTIKEDGVSIDDLLMERRNGDSGTLKKGDGMRYKGDEDIVKRKQHEMLMEEFRLAHRKMFGQQQNGSSNEDKFENKQDTLKKMPSNSSTKSSPPIPLPKTQQKTKITVNGQTPSSHSQTLPRPDRILSKVCQKSIDDLDGPQSASGQVNFRITFDTKRPSGASAVDKKFEETKGTLVQVKPWTTRL